jgi:hydrogenase maturation protease
MSDRILVAGIGNIFQTDDGFGVEVATRLLAREWPEGVEVAEFGIRGVHLAYQLLDGYRALILVDAMPMNEIPGTLAVIDAIEGAGGGDEEAAPVMDAHTMSPDVVLGTLAHLGGKLDRGYVVGCQPANLDDGMGLTAAVAEAVDGAVDLCCELVSELLQPAGKESRS